MKSNIFKIILTISISLLVISLIVILLIMKIIPIKYILMGISLFSIITGTIIYLLFSINKGWVRVISIIYIVIELILIVISLFISYKSSSVISKLTNVKYVTISYSVITLKDNSSDILSYKGKNMGIIKDMGYTTEVEKEINKKIEVKVKESDNLALVVDQLLSKTIDSILIESNYLDVLEESDTKVLESIKTIYTFDIKVKQKDIKKEVDVKIDPFIVLISGIDIAGPINTKSRSDVNIIMVVNPITYQILLIHIPRDYYVEFHNKGTKDKLTHTGIFGIDMTVSTIEDFMDIDINYYVRINFSTLTSLIDVIGDINVYNTVAFNSYGTYYPKGNITLNGNKALLFSRTRKVLTGGDLDRGKNQERVIEAIINKMSIPNITKNAYNILDVMSNSFVTNFSSDELKKLINLELDHLPNWKIDSYNLNGKGILTKGTPFYPNRFLYVVKPDNNTINKAKEYINNIITTKEG